MEENKENNKKEAPNSQEPRPKRSIRTYADDVASLIKSGTTLSDVALSEQKRRLSEKEKVLPEEEGGANKVVIIVAVVLIALGIVIVAGSFLFGGNSDEEETEAITISSIIFANSRQEVSLNELKRIEVLKKINQSRNATELPLGAINNLYLTEEEGGVKSLLGANDFLRRIEIRGDDAFIRSLEKDFMLGAHSFDGNQGFLLFKVKSFDNALSKIINWEKFMLDDLWPMFYNQKPRVDTEGISSLQGEFRDIVLRNRDARILEDELGETALIYSFPDRRHLIITTDKSTLIEVFDRLTTGRFKN